MSHGAHCLCGWWWRVPDDGMLPSYSIHRVPSADFASAVIALFAANAEDASHPRVVLAEGQCDLWVAEVDAKVVAVALATSEYVREGARYAGVENLLVDASFRRRGIGRALMQAVEGHYGRSGFGGLQLAADADNASAIALYESLAFVVSRRYERTRSGQIQQRVQMLKPFHD